MRVATLIDTSILLEILAVPGKSQDPEAHKAELRERMDRGEVLLLPTATVIETGNHIAQLPGDARRDRATKLCAFLHAAAATEPPWTVLGARWDAELLLRIADGGARGAPGLEDFASRGVGAGDASIIVEATDYERRVANVEVRIWTLDRELRAYA